MDVLSAKMEALPIKDVPLALVFGLLTVAAVVFRLVQASDRPVLDHIPVLGKGDVKERRNQFAKHGLDLLKEGYEKFQKAGKIFQLESSEGPRIVVGPKQLEELGRLPDTVVDNRAPIMEGLAAKYTKLPFADDVVIHSIRADLTPKLGQLNEILAEEVDSALKTELPTAEDWTPIQVYAKLLRIVAIVSTRLFIGPTLAHNEEWLKVAIGYTVNLVEGARIIKLYRPWLRPFIYRFLPEFRALYKNRQDAIRLLTPIIKERREAEGKEGYEKPSDMLQWMMDSRIKKHSHDRDYYYQAEHQLILAFAAIHTTTNAVTHMLYDLGTMPDFVDTIRQEIKTELSKNGGAWDGKLMKSLKKTDSFMKESQRHNPIGFTLFTRRILKPVTLSDGTQLPAGSNVTANSHLINHDENLVGEDPWAFDPLRFYKKGLDTDGPIKEVAGKHQFVSLSMGSQMFGYGRHACPGRFFAGNEIKLVLVKMLDAYDIKLEGTNERYKNWYWEGGNNPDATKNILIKRVKE